MLAIERSMIVIIYVIKSYSLHDAARKEASNISAQDKVGNFCTIIKCHSLQNRPTIFFHFPGERRQTRGVSEGKSVFFSGCSLLTCLASRVRFVLVSVRLKKVCH